MSGVTLTTNYKLAARYNLCYLYFHEWLAMTQ